MEETVSERMYNMLKEFSGRDLDEAAIGELMERAKFEMEKDNGGKDTEER